MGQNVKNHEPLLRPGSRMIFGPFINGTTETSRLVDPHGKPLVFSTEPWREDDKHAHFEEKMPIPACCYTATIIGLTFGLRIESSSMIGCDLAFKFSKEQIDYIAPREITFKRGSRQIVIGLPGKDIVTNASHAPAANLGNIAGILAALHGFNCRETAGIGKIVWRRNKTETAT